MGAAAGASSGGGVVSVLEAESVMYGRLFPATLPRCAALLFALVLASWYWRGGPEGGGGGKYMIVRGIRKDTRLP